MFNNEFYPTPFNIIHNKLCYGLQIKDKNFLEPNVGKGDIVDYLLDKGAKQVLGCEIDSNLRKIAETKCRILASDFLTLKSEQISHIDYIVMNPPFSNGVEHLLYAYSIAPSGCEIRCLLNSTNITNPYSKERKELLSIIQNYGSWENLGDCFSDAERKTGVEVALVTINKNGENYTNEFEGFFIDADVEEKQENGIMSYNVVRDLVNRYVEAIKIFDEQLNVANKLKNITGSFFGGELGFKCDLSRDEYKKELQKAGWHFIFEKMNLTKLATKGLREDINKFVEQQTHIPFTMKNIYKMLEIVIGTAGQRMDKAILEAFDRITERHHENRYSVKGWKTNLHYLVGKKFILPYMINPAKEYGFTSENYSYLKDGFGGAIQDLEKALCYITGEQYPSSEYCSKTNKWVNHGILTVSHSIKRNYYGEWYECHFFKYKGYKNGNMHFEFKDENVWGLFNKKVAELKGYPLFEAKEQTKYQKRNSSFKK